ncbi:hypothetical protein [Paractinoplanes rishiriensis]|nr:hypothetical protein [Actinoplanes rishiriensis]
MTKPRAMKPFVGVTDGRVTFGEAVARVTESLNPLGAIGKVIAESTACAVALKELEVAGRRIDAETEVVLTKLANRRQESAASLRQLRQQAGGIERTAEQLRRCIRNMQAALARPRTTVEEAQVYAALIRGFSDDLLSHHDQQGNQVLSGIDRVLNGRDGGPPVRPVAPSPRRAGTASQPRRGRPPQNPGQGAAPGGRANGGGGGRRGRS